MSYTPEPWKKLRDPESDSVAFMVESEELDNSPPRGIAHWMREADADRSVACVNGCAGLTEDEIAEAIHWYKMRKQAGVATTLKRDAAYRECVEALKLIMQMLDDGRLVRPIDKDGDAGYFLRTAGLVLDLKKIQLALAHAEAQP